MINMPAARVSSRVCTRACSRAAKGVSSRAFSSVPIACASTRSLNKRQHQQDIHRIQQRRAFILKPFKWILGFSDEATENEPTFENRFHAWESSPSLVLRNRAATIKALAKCPVTGDTIEFTCPNCGIPTHHDEASWEADEHHHNEVCEKLMLGNVFEHDIRSGREFPEFEMPPPQDEDVAINFANWDTFLYTRDFHSMDTEFELAHSTKVLTYPITIGSLLHQGSPHTREAKRLTLEGLKSLAGVLFLLSFPYISY